MRGYKWKMLDVAMSRAEVTSADFSEATGLPRPQCSPYAHILVQEDYLLLVREEEQAHGGRPLKVYTWSGKQPPRTAGRAFRAVHEGDSMWGKTPVLLLAACIDNMVRLREDTDAQPAMASAV